jgi:hypothetical protein
MILGFGRPWRRPPPPPPPGPRLQAESGSVAIQVAVLLSILIGFVALGSEIVYLLYKQRQMQSAADSAALGGASALTFGYPADFRLESNAIAAQAGFVAGVDGVTVTVNNPPATGGYAGASDAVEVIVHQPQQLYLASLFGPGTYDVRARAVATRGNNGAYCVLALDPSASGALSVKNNGVVSNPNCGVAVNSGSGSALTVSNNGAINGPVTVHGNWSLSNNAHLNGTPLKNYAPVTNDPYAGVTVQAAPGCTSQSGTVMYSTAHLNPGHFCSGWNFSNNATVTLAAGAYYIDSQLTMANNVVVTGTGVTLIVNGTYAISIGNNISITLSAQTSGPYAGLAVFGTRSGSASTTQTFSNNTTLKVTGAIYFPSQTVAYSNNSSTGASNGCTQVIGRIVQIQNNVYLDNHCDSTGVKPIGQTPVKLVE